jgi:hypothetical protein
MNKVLILGALAAMICSSTMCGASGGRQKNEALYGNVPVQHYLKGLFDPSADGQFVAIATLGIDENNGPHYLRREAAEALAKMLADFHRENPGIRIYVQSSTRNFESQKSIWNAKWRGE